MRRIALILGLTTLTSPALADAIDGDWCLDSKHLSIKGPEIKKPPESFCEIMIQGMKIFCDSCYVQIKSGDTHAICFKPYGGTAPRL
jgi:hypothetical protein